MGPRWPNHPDDEHNLDILNSDCDDVDFITIRRCGNPPRTPNEGPMENHGWKYKGAKGEFGKTPHYSDSTMSLDCKGNIHFRLCIHIFVL